MDTGKENVTKIAEMIKDVANNLAEQVRIIDNKNGSDRFFNKKIRADWREVYGR